MKKNHISRRRGTSIAAAALSFALVAPFVNAVTPGSPVVSVADAQEADASASSSKAIYSPGKASQQGTISGSVKEVVEANIGFGTVQAKGNPLEGVKVYAQWYEGADTEHSSPVYYTETDANGNFSINMAPYTDALGVTREFRADASVGTPDGGDWSWDENREKIRVWTELPADMTDKYRLMHQPAAGIFPGIGADTTPTTQGDGTWGDNKVTNMTIQYVQKDALPQHLPKNEWVESVGRTSNSGNYAGTAFWNLDVLQGALNHNTVNAKDGKDLAAPGLKVVGSYLTDEAVAKIHEYAANNFAGKKLRSRDKNEWTPADEAGLQRWINEQVAADPQGWIAETVTTTTGADGRFQLFWKGLYGNSYKGNDGLIGPDADKLHKLAGSWEEGSLANSNKDSKHINMDWSYVSVYDAKGNPLPDNIGVMYPWSLGRWMGPNFGGNWGGGDAQFFGGDNVYIGHTTDGYTGWKMALAPQALKFDVVEKNTYDNWAKLGDTVKTDTSGLPITQDLSYYIEWVDKDGKVVKTCETAKADSATKIPSCDLKVPADAQTGDTFTARLKVTDGDADPKNDLVLAQDAFAVAREYLDYDEVKAKAEKEATAKPIFDNPETEDVETKPENASFELGELPEGVTEDQVKVDPKTGVVTFTPKAEQAGKTITFPVVMRNEDVQVPVLDENGDQKVDADGNPVTQGRIVTRGEAPFKVATNAAVVTDPETVVEGKEAAPFETAKDVPEGGEVKVENLPGGLTVDPATGQVTGTPDKLTDWGKEEESRDVTVKVTITDAEGNEVATGDKVITVQRDTDNDGTPDADDDDDDNDGFTDAEEKEAGTDPKDPDSKPSIDSDKTRVDSSDVKPVDPTDDKQDTGVKVTNPDDDTKISAKDEDGKDVPVEIDDNGNVVVTPGTDVDGPITVTIEDPDLPGGKVDVEVPVNGHEKGVDDNGSEAQPGDEKTEVDPSDVKPVKPTDEKQDTGVKVTNPDDDTKVSATDEDGKTIPAEIDDNGNVVVTPGEDVDGPITVVVEDPDLPGGKTEIEVPVEGHEKGVDDNGKTTTASEEDPQYGDAVTVKPGESADSANPFGEKGAPEGTTITVNTPKDATGWEFTGDENGVITGQAPSNEELAKQFAELGTKDWDKVVEALTPVAEPQVGVDFEYADGSKDTADAKFQLVGQDGKSILDPNGDADGDGVSNKEEAEKGSNPFDKNDTPKDATPAPTPQGPADPGKCVATAVGFGLPLLALIPIGLATQLSIPGLTDFVENVSMDLERANAQIQKNLGMFNPETAKALSQMNAQLRKAGFDLATVGAGLAVIAAGILAGTLLYENCAPGDAKSSVKVDSLKGSSGKTWTSSEKDQK